MKLNHLFNEADEEMRALERAASRGDLSAKQKLGRFKERTGIFTLGVYRGRGGNYRVEKEHDVHEIGSIPIIVGVSPEDLEAAQEVAETIQNISITRENCPVCDHWSPNNKCDLCVAIYIAYNIHNALDRGFFWDDLDDIKPKPASWTDIKQKLNN